MGGVWPNRSHFMILREQVTFLLLLLALCVLPFILEVSAFPFIRDTITDFRSTKEILALLFATGITIWALTGGHIFKCKNPGVLWLLFYLIAHPLVAPPFNLQAFGTNIANIWEYKPMVYALIFMGMFCVISNLRLKKEHIDTILKVMMWTGFISAIYVLIQKIGCDQFQYWSEGIARNVTNGDLTATFTQPNYSSLYIAFMVPVCLYFRKYFFAVVMAAVVLLINSKMGLLAMLIGSGFFVFRQNQKVFGWLCLAGVILSVVYFSITPDVKLDWQDNGRYSLWKDIFNACTHPWIAEKPFFITGHGLGSYPYIYVASHPWSMYQAHNEFLQFLFDAGFVGVSLLLFSIFWLLKKINPFTITDSQTVVLTGMFLAILASAVGLFTWQIEPHRFISVTIFALLHNKLLTRED